MFIRPIHIRKNGKEHAYWALVESRRTERGPRQRVVAYLGQIEEECRLGVKEAAEGGAGAKQEKLFGGRRPQWVEVDAARVRVENCRDFGAPWLAMQLVRTLGLDEFLKRTVPSGREEIAWWAMTLVLVLARLCHPSSELEIAEHFYRTSALSDLLGIAPEKVNEDRLYRAMDALLPHKEALEVFLKSRLGSLFELDYELLLYDVTSTYFEGQAEANALAARGYSRDHRPDCKQVCIGLVVSVCGMALGHEVFAGNTADVATLQGIVETMERRYGRASRIWVADRGVGSEENVKFLREGGRRYIIGTPKGKLKIFRDELVSDGWTQVRQGLEVKVCAHGEETFILCRSRDRRQKEKAMHARFEKRIQEGLERIEAGCLKRRYKVATLAGRVGKLLGRNSRAAGLFKTEVAEAEDGRARLVWSKAEAWRRWADLSEGCYLLRSNVSDWTADQLWKAYIQLTDAEAAFRIHKSALHVRPVWHQKAERVRGHILVCFLAYVLWKTLSQLCSRAGLGEEPRRVLEEIAKIKVVDVVMPTRAGVAIRKRCITRPTDHQKVLLQRLGLRLPEQIEMNAV